ncbi:MAG: hypothetical protein EOP11_17475, partial [Proteobacteria bacterium]
MIMLIPFFFAALSFANPSAETPMGEAASGKAPLLARFEKTCLQNSSAEGRPQEALCGCLKANLGAKLSLEQLGLLVRFYEGDAAAKALVQKPANSPLLDFDMEAAEQLVPDITTVGYSGGVSKSAVRGMLARVNLHMAGEPLNDKTRYAEASKWAKKVMDDALAGHELNPSYAQVFINVAQDKYDIKESIWEVEFTGNRTDA